MKLEKVCVVRIKRWILVVFNRCQINAVVFEAGMVAHHRDAERREKDGQ